MASGGQHLGVGMVCAGEHRYEGMSAWSYGGLQVAGQGPSRQELIRRQRQAGFIGRQGELTAFREALKQSPQEATQFLFHIHGPAGVGKSTLVRQLESMAREAHALTAYADESSADPVEAMEAICAQFAHQGTELKRIEKLLVLQL